MRCWRVARFGNSRDIAVLCIILIKVKLYTVPLPPLANALFPVWFTHKQHEQIRYRQRSAQRSSHIELRCGVVSRLRLTQPNFRANQRDSAAGSHRCFHRERFCMLGARRRRRGFCSRCNSLLATKKTLVWIMNTLNV